MRTSSKKTKRPLTARLSKNFGSLKDKFEKRLSQDMSKIKKEIKALESLDLKSKFKLNPKASKGSLILCGEKVKNVPKLIDLTVRKMEEAYNELLPEIKKLAKAYNDTLENTEKILKAEGATKEQIEEAVYNPRSSIGEAGRSLTMYQPGTRAMVKSDLTSEYKKNKEESDKTFLAYIKDPDTVEDLKNVDTYPKDACKEALKYILQIRDNFEGIKSSTISRHEEAIEELKEKAQALTSRVEKQQNPQVTKESNEQNKKIEDLNEKIKKEHQRLSNDIKKNLKNPLRSTLNKKPVANKSSKTLKIGTKIIKDCDELEEVTKKRLNFTINKLNEKVSTLSDTLTNYYDTVIDTIETGNRLGIYDTKETERQKKEFGKRWQEEVAGCLNEDLDKLSNVKKTFNKLWKMNKKKEKENQEIFEKLIDEPSFLKSAYTKGAKKNNSAVLYSVKLLHWLPQIFEKFGDKLENIDKVAFEFYKYS